MTYGSIPPTTTSQTHTHTLTYTHTHPSFCPYGLTWLQCECGKILVKSWYVAAALAETLPDPPDVLFFTSGGYNAIVCIQWGRNIFEKFKVHFLKWTQIMWKLYFSTSTYATLQYEGLGTAFIPVGHIKRLADESLGEKKQNFWVSVPPTNLKN